MQLQIHVPETPQIKIVNAPQWKELPHMQEFHIPPNTFTKQPEINIIPQNVPEKTSEENSDDEQQQQQKQSKSKKTDREEIKARNRIAAKKWRDKKDDSLYTYEALNDNLREEAMRLRNDSLTLLAENRVLENELRFFQTFMTKIMNGAPKPPPI